MILEWDTRGDFDEVVDTLESVTLLRRGGDPAGELQSGWRFAESVTDPIGWDGAVQVVDTTWQLPAVPGEPGPRVGDVIRDGDGLGSVVRSVTRLRGLTRWSIATRRCGVSPLHAELFSLERPIFTSGPGGLELSGWELIRAGVVAVILPAEDAALGAKRAYLANPAPAVQGDRLRDASGVEHLVGATPAAPELGDPQVIELAPPE